MPAIDPVPLLMRNTAQGVLSRIAYEKQDGRGPSQRVIEPQIMVEGGNSGQSPIIVISRDSHQFETPRDIRACPEVFPSCSHA